jgi:hypothetical protein
VTVRTAAGATVELEIDYPRGGIRVTDGTATGGAYRFKWRVPRRKGRVALIATVATSDGGQGAARGSFRIR